MLTRRRAPQSTIRPSVLVFLRTGELSEVLKEDQWLAWTLRDPRASEARQRFAAGDEAGTRALLLEIPGGHNCFL